MFIHIWRMRARKKRIGDYEKFGRQVTLPSLKKIDGCLGAHFIKIFEARKPEYMWLVFWRDHKALEQARTNPLWREQIKRFEAGKYYKSIPLELVCEALESFTQPPAKPKRAARPSRAAKASKVEESQSEESPAEESAPVESSGQGVTGPMVEGE
jgi:hypothetical protein